MKQPTQLNVTRLLTILACLGGTSLLYASDIAALVDRAELIVVGKATRQGATAAGTVTATLRIDRILKGTASALVTVEIEPFRPGARPFVPLANECGMWLLLPVGGDKWGPVSKQPDSLYFPLPNCAGTSSLVPPAEAQLAERIAFELIAAADAFDGQRGYASRLYSLLGNRVPLAKSQLIASFSSPRNPHLLTVALAFQIEQQDASALLRMEANSHLFANSGARSGLHVAVGKFRNPDPAGIHVLGRIVSRSGAPATKFLHAAATEALAMIHTKEAIPYLAELLFSADPRDRSWAIHGLSLFRLKLPPLSSKEFEVAVRNALHPDGQPLAGKEREFIHFGLFQDPATESAHVAYYKSWWAENRAAMGF